MAIDGPTSPPDDDALKSSQSVSEVDTRSRDGGDNFYPLADFTDFGVCEDGYTHIAEM